MLQQYVIHEIELEAKRAELQAMTLLVSRQVFDDSSWRDWKSSVTGMWKGYVSKLTGEDIPDESDTDKALIDYYTNVVKKAEVKMFKDKNTGQLTLVGANNVL